VLLEQLRKAGVAGRRMLCEADDGMSILKGGHLT